MMEYIVVSVLVLCQKSVVSQLIFLQEDHCKLTENKITVNDESQSIRRYNSYYDRYDYSERRTKEIVTDSSAQCEGFTLTTNKRLFTTSNPYNLQSIVFQQSNLSLVPTGIFDTFTNLTKLDLNNNFVKLIHPGAFTGLISLKELHLENNIMGKVSRGILNSLSSLKELHLENNNITEIEEYAFTGLNSLENLYIGNNSLTYILPTTLDQLTVLIKIDFSHNYLQQFDINPIPSVTHCDVSYNLLSDIRLSIFSNRLTEIKLQHNIIDTMIAWKEDTNIKHIDISHNNLSDTFDVGSTVTYLDLSDNSIVSLNLSMFSHAKDLNTLHLGYNFIANLSTEFPDVLVALKYLHFSNNRLSVIPVGSFRYLHSLIVLDLSYNQLSEIDYGTFTGLDALERLDLSNNELIYLYESSLYRLSNLKQLRLQNNHLTVLDTHELKMNVKSLTQIQIDENDWTCKFLSKLVTDFNNLGVTITPGSTATISNIHGIACKPSSIDVNKKIKNHTDANEDILKNSIQASNSLIPLRDYFDKDFFLSNFYKYFETWKDAKDNRNESGTQINFPELMLNMTEFQKTFDENFTKSEFYRFFNGTLQNRINSAVSAIGTYTGNFSANTNYSLTSMQELLNARIYKLINTTLQHVIDSNFKRFENLSDAKLKELVPKDLIRTIPIENRDEINKNNISSEQVSAYAWSRSLTTGSVASETSNHFEKSHLQQGTGNVSNIVFMVINSIMLVAILFVLCLMYVQMKLTKVFHKQSSGNNDPDINNSEAHMELM